MGFLNAIMSMAQPQSSYQNDPTNNFWYQPINPQTQSGAYVGLDTGLYVSAIFQAIRLISESLAKVPLHVYRRTDDGEGRERVRDHYIATSLGRSPNGWLKSYQYRTLAQAQVLSRGNHYAQVLNAGRGLMFNPLHPDGMQVKKLPRRSRNEPRRVGYMYSDPEDGMQYPLAQEEVFHLRGPMLSTNDVQGVSALTYARETVGSAITQQSYSDTLYRQGAMHRGLYSVPGKLEPEQHAQMVEFIKRETSGPSAWGSSLLLSNGATWTPTGMTAADAEFILSRKFTVIDIARWFNMQPHLLRDLDKSSYSNHEQESLEFAQITMLPHFVNWEQTIDVDLIGGNQFFTEFLLDAIVRADLKTRYDSYGIAIEKGFMVPNEARQKENWNALPGLERPRISLNIAMIDEDGDIMPPPKNLNQATERPAGAPAPSQNGNGAQPQNGAARQDHYDRMLNAWTTQLNNIEIRELKAIFTTKKDRESTQKDDGLKFYERFARNLTKFLCIEQIKADAFVDVQSKRFLNAIETGAQDEMVSDLVKKGQQRLLTFVLEEGLAEEIENRGHELDGLAEENGKRAV